MSITPSTLSSEPRMPAYQSIKQAILARIHAGEWPTGSAIPSENRLAQAFGVSRMTVNRALKELSEERVLQRRQGAGTYVAQQQFKHLFVEVRNIAEDIQADNKRYEAKVLFQKRLAVKEINADILHKLSVPMLAYRQVTNPTEKTTSPQLTPLDAENALIDSVHIVHIADGQPIQFEERWVNARLVPNFINQDFSHVNTSDYLIAHAPLESGHYTIRAVIAPPAVASALQMQAGEPALLLSRQTYSVGQVVTFVNMWHASHHYQLSGNL